jgi:ribosomal-protein-alanine N-acetyltransferase
MGITTRGNARVHDWKDGLPALTGTRVTLRELRISDAPAMLATLTDEQVSRFIAPPPTTVQGFERFIAWTVGERAAGRYACFAVVPAGSDEPIGLFQVRALDPAFSTAEWGFAIRHERWGSGDFTDAATLIVDFVFEILDAHRLEARAAIANGRGNGALQKIGALREAVLRKSFLCRGEYLDQALWTIVRDEWRRARTAALLRSRRVTH